MFGFNVQNDDKIELGRGDLAASLNGGMEGETCFRPSRLAGEHNVHSACR